MADGYVGGMLKKRPIIRTFTGHRPQPPAEYQDKGITNSGTAPDYYGVIFPDGTVVIRWATAYQSHSIWASYADFYQVHGHPEYGTTIVFDDGQPAELIEHKHPAPCPKCGNISMVGAALRGRMVTCDACLTAEGECGRAA